MNYSKYCEKKLNMTNAEAKAQLSAEGTTSDLISRQAAIDTEGLEEEIRCEMCKNPMHTDRGCDGNCKYDEKLYEKIMQILNERIKPLPPAEPEIIRCKDCKYFELDHFEKMEEFPVPIIVAHEICMKWSDGCRTSKDGWCFMGERRTDDQSK